MPRTFKILRFDPLKADAAPYFQEYRHEPRQQDSILDALKDIRDSRTLPCPSATAAGKRSVARAAWSSTAGSTLACRTQVAGSPSEEIVIEPLPNLEIQKDLIVDLTPFWKAYRQVEPFLQAPGPVPEKGHRVAEEDMEKVFQYITCILCACCYSACPVATRDGRYVGPAALAKLYRFAIDPRDERPFSALERMDGPEGVWGCDTVFRCNDACPKDVRPADGIEGLRRKLIAGKTKRLFRRKP